MGYKSDLKTLLATWPSAVTVALYETIVDWHDGSSYAKLKADDEVGGMTPFDHFEAVYPQYFADYAAVAKRSLVVDEDSTGQLFRTVCWEQAKRLFNDFTRSADHAAKLTAAAEYRESQESLRMTRSEDDFSEWAGTVPVRRYSSWSSVEEAAMEFSTDGYMKQYNGVMLMVRKGYRLDIVHSYRTGFILERFMEASPELRVSSNGSMRKWTQQREFVVRSSSPIAFDGVLFLVPSFNDEFGWSEVIEEWVEQLEDEEGLEDDEQVA